MVKLVKNLPNKKYEFQKFSIMVYSSFLKLVLVKNLIVNTKKQNTLFVRFFFDSVSYINRMFHFRFKQR